MPPAISWHRGGRELAPSATLAAFAAAAEQAAEWIEVDVRRTRDGRLVCAHDPHLVGIGRIAELDYENLPAASRAAVPTLEDFLGALDDAEALAGPRRSRSGIHLDLKGTGHESQAIDLVRRSGRRLLVTTLHDEGVVAAIAAAPDVPVLLSLGRAGTGLSPGARLALHTSELWPYGRLRRCGATGVAVMYLLANPGLRRWCRTRHMTVLVWTIDSTGALRRWLRRRNVDIVTTNRPIVALRLRDRPPGTPGES
jgi:glycerophosphoryl diester phosphodiesterase